MLNLNIAETTGHAAEALAQALQEKVLDVSYVCSLFSCNLYISIYIHHIM